MLRISIIEDQGKRQLILEGKLVAPWTSELKDVCERVTADPSPRELVVDLRSVTVIGDDGKDVLLTLLVRGARFRSSGVFTKQILKQLAQRAARSGKENRPHRA